MNGEDLTTLCTGLNGGATIDSDLLTALVAQGRSILFNERDWVFLRRTDTTVTVSASTSSWNTSISISGIADFSRFYQDDLGYQIKLFDGNNMIEYYRQVPWSKRLEYKDVPNTFVHDFAGKKIYINGNIPFAGTLYINIIMIPTPIDLTSEIDLETAGSFPVPSRLRFADILAYYAIGVNKGAVDFDSINREMLPNNKEALVALKSSMEKWDTNLQLAEQMATDPTGETPGYRSNAINMNA